MKISSIVVFLKSASTKTDLIALAGAFMYKGARQMHISENDEYIRIYNYTGNLNDLKIFKDMPNVSDVFVAFNNDAVKPNFIFDDSITVEQNVNRICKPKVESHKSAAMELVKSYTKEDIDNTESAEKRRYKNMRRIGTPATTVGKRIRKMHNSPANTLEDIFTISPKDWSTYFKPIDDKIDLRSFYAKNSIGRPLYDTHPRKVMNTYIVYLSTTNWVETEALTRGMFEEFCNVKICRYIIDDWFESGVLNRLLDAYTSIEEMQE